MCTRLYVQGLDLSVSAGPRIVWASSGYLQALTTLFLIFFFLFQRKSNTNIASHVWSHASVKEIITTANDLDMRWSSWST